MMSVTIGLHLPCFVGTDVDVSPGIVVVDSGIVVVVESIGSTVVAVGSVPVAGSASASWIEVRSIKDRIVAVSVAGTVAAGAPGTVVLVVAAQGRPLTPTVTLWRTKNRPWALATPTLATAVTRTMTAATARRFLWGEEFKENRCITSLRYKMDIQ